MKRFSNDRNNFSDDVLRKAAFTLAEVLITLGIIGVVAALTIPFLKAEINAVVLKNKLKKHYTEISKAVQTMKANDYDLSITMYKERAQYSNNFNQSFQGNIIDCNSETTTKCGYNAYRNAIRYNNVLSSLSGGYDGNLYNAHWWIFNRIAFPDGAFLSMGTGDAFQANMKDVYFTLFLNGFNSKRIVGYDTFVFYLDPIDGLVLPFATKTDVASDGRVGTFSCKNNNVSLCTYKALYEDNYFKEIIKEYKLN